MKISPFRPYRPVWGDDFTNRLSELDLALDRIIRGLSLIIIGEPRIGKTSLLLQLERIYLPIHLPSTQFSVIYFSPEILQSNATIIDFWNHIINNTFSDHADVEEFKKEINPKSYSYEAIYTYFDKLGKSGRRVVILFDEFEELLNENIFLSKHKKFIGLIQFITKNTAGLCVVAASRISLEQINSAMNTGNPIHSRDIFDFEPYYLRGFDDKTIDLWLLEHLKPELVRIAKMLSGHHPALLHVASDILLGTDLPLRRDNIDQFIQKASLYYYDLWGFLDPKSQLTLLLLLLKDLDGKLERKIFDLDEVDKTLNWVEAQLNNLGRRSIIIKSSSKWSIDSLGLKIWLIQNIANEFVEVIDPIDWLKSKEFKMGIPLRKDEIDFLGKIINKIPTGIYELALKAYLGIS